MSTNNDCDIMVGTRLTGFKAILPDKYLTDEKMEIYKILVTHPSSSGEQMANLKGAIFSL